MKFFSIEEQKSFREVFLQKSKTIPSAALTPKQILEHFTQPSYDELAQLGFYDDEVSLDVDKIDASEFEDLTDLMSFSLRAEELQRLYSEAMSKPLKKVVKNETKDETRETTAAETKAD